MWRRTGHESHVAGPGTVGRVGRPGRRYDWWSAHQTLFRAASWLAFGGKERALRAAALDALALDPGEAVLDDGCGPGVNFPALRDRVGEIGRVLGVDVSVGMVGRARDCVADAGWRNAHTVRAASPSSTPSRSSPASAGC